MATQARKPRDCFFSVEVLRKFRPAKEHVLFYRFRDQIRRGLVRISWFERILFSFCPGCLSLSQNLYITEILYGKFFNPFEVFFTLRVETFHTPFFVDLQELRWIANRTDAKASAHLD
jgi:hypothetical protein